MVRSNNTTSARGGRLPRCPECGTVFRDVELLVLHRFESHDRMPRVGEPNHDILECLLTARARGVSAVRAASCQKAGRWCGAKCVAL